MHGGILSLEFVQTFYRFSVSESRFPYFDAEYCSISSESGYTQHLVLHIKGKFIFTQASRCGYPWKATYAWRQPKSQEGVHIEATQTDENMTHRIECINGMLKIKERKLLDLKYKSPKMLLLIGILLRISLFIRI